MPRPSRSEPRNSPTGEERRRLLEILRSNQGFSEPERWVEYAWQHTFKKTLAEKLIHCPDCGAGSYTTIGQYVYYSTLARLRTCSNCGLVYSDSRIDPEVIQTHFEQSYKDEDYFRKRRRRIVRQIAHLVDRFSPRCGRALDVGGATGYQMAVVKQIRPDLEITICDVSEVACAAAASRYGFKTICGRLTTLEDIKERFHVVVMSDVIYYEPDLAGQWKLLSDLVADGGSVIIRVPNTLTPMRIVQWILRLLKPRKAAELSDRVSFFNPEHLYIFPPRFLIKRLRTTGFDTVFVLPSELPISNWKRRYLHALWYGMATAVHFLSFGQFVITPSILVVGTRRAPGLGTTSPAKQSK